MKSSQVITKLSKEYEKSMGEAREAKGRAVRGNRFPFQTRIAVSNLLIKAKEESADIRMLTGCLPVEFYNEKFIQELTNCLETGSKVQILAWNSGRTTIPDVFQKLSEKYDGVEIRQAEGPTAADSVPHMLLVGDKHFRLEQPHGSFDDVKFDDLSPEIPARIVFNDEAECSELKNLFDLAWRYSELRGEKENA